MKVCNSSSMLDHIKEICVAVESAGRNRPDMTAETVFADGVPPISAVESRCLSKLKHQEYAARNTVWSFNKFRGRVTTQNFTRNFEDTAVWLSLHLSRKAVAEYLRISWDTVGPIISRVEKEISAHHQPLDNLVNIGIDETSYKKGHKYITVIVNHDTNTVVWAAKGHGKSVLEPFFKQLSSEQRSKIRLVSGDGARWIKETIDEYCPNAEFCIDPFHVVSWCTTVLDEVRREEWNKARAELAKEPKKKSGRGRPKGGSKQKSAAEQRVEAVKSSKYPLLMNPDNLNEAYQAKLKQLLLHNRRLATAYRLKEELRLIFKLNPGEVSAALDKWRRRAWSCRIDQYVELQRKIKRHKDAIIATIGFLNNFITVISVTELLLN